jgi:phospholipid/cholesterol/gamma-HCH transport system substrate-binding protein
METHARYVTIGLFSLAVIVAAFLFAYWLRGMGGLKRAEYLIRFDGPVSGLVSGSPVLFNGVRVGEVTGVVLDESDPNRTSVLASVVRTAPVRTDSKVDVETQGFLGEPALALSGGSGPALRDSPDKPPTLEAKGAAQDLSSVVRGAFRRFDALVADNADALHETINNLKSFTGVLARNSDRIEAILASLERLGGGSSKQTVTLYELAAPAMPALDNAPPEQLTVSEPTAVVALDTQKILHRSESGETVPAEDGQWSDSLPKLLHAKIIHTFENAGYMRVVRAADGLRSDHQLLLDLRRFHVTLAPERIAEVEFTAKIADGDKVSDGRLFRATAPVRGDGSAAAAAALNEAFAEAAIDLVKWAASALAGASPPSETSSKPK